MFTPTEAGAVAAVYALFVALFIYREMKFRDLFEVLYAAAETTAIVMLLVAASAVSAFLITLADLPSMIVELMRPLAGSPIVLMLAIMVFVMIVGMVMDLTPTVLILVPVLMPLVKDAGIDPIYFGVVFILSCSIGLITPPVGNVLNVISGVSRMPFEDCVKGVLPYLGSMLVLLILLTVFPPLILVPLKWIS